MSRRPGVRCRGWRHTSHHGRTCQGHPTGCRWPWPPCHQLPGLHLHPRRHRRRHRQQGQLMQPRPRCRMDRCRMDRRLLGRSRPSQRAGPHHRFTSSPGTPARSTTPLSLHRLHLRRPHPWPSTSPTRPGVPPSAVPGSRCRTARPRARRQAPARTAVSGHWRMGTQSLARTQVVAPLPLRRGAPLLLPEAAAEGEGEPLAIGLVPGGRVFGLEVAPFPIHASASHWARKDRRRMEHGRWRQRAVAAACAGGGGGRTRQQASAASGARGCGWATATGGGGGRST